MKQDLTNVKSSEIKKTSKGTEKEYKHNYIQVTRNKQHIIMIRIFVQILPVTPDISFDKLDSLHLKEHLNGL
jgi:hypothetical protein